MGFYSDDQWYASWDEAMRDEEFGESYAAWLDDLRTAMDAGAAAERAAQANQPALPVYDGEVPF